VTRRRALLLAPTLALSAAPARALMAGQAPDTPAARVDPNGPAGHTAAVAVLVDGAVYSGVVVSPQHVLTAAHVVGAHAPAALRVRVHADAVPAEIASAAVQRFPGTSFPYDDLALLTLAEPVPRSVQVPPVRREPLPLQQVITVVGHGWSGSGDNGPSVPGSPEVKRRGRNVADRVQTTVDASGRSSLFVLFDFDGPAGNGTWGGGTLGNGDETGLASGDSGSPLFAEIAGVTWLVGIANLVAPPAGRSVNDYRFGTLCGGILLAEPRLHLWLDEQTGGTLGRQPADDADVPLPWWSAAAIGGLLAWRSRRASAR
jgi:hypothetical protein